MNIGIIGAGHVGGTLGRRWAKSGHKVVFSSRNPGSPAMQAVVSEAGAGATAASVTDAVNANDILLLATPWSATREIIESVSLDNKILIDATNPLLPDLSGLDVGTTNSAAEMIQSWAPKARVVKAFNTVGANVMANPLFGNVKAVLFYCGDDAEAKQVVRQLAAELDFDACDAGPLKQARLLEPFALLWISLALKANFSRQIAFQFLRP